MPQRHRATSVFCAALAGSWLLLPGAHAGGSGLNTVVVANQDSSNSVELANYFLERRQLPPENLLRIHRTGGPTMWTADECQTNLVQPLLAMLASRGLTNQVDYVVLSMDIPFQTVRSTPTVPSPNGTTSALFYGPKPDGGTSWKGVVNSYAGSESIFSLNRPSSAPGYSFLTTMLTSDSLAEAKQIVDQGVAADGQFPQTPVILQKTSDPVRNVRYTQFDGAVINARVLGVGRICQTNGESPPPPLALGYETGLANYTIPPNTFSPGAIADSFTSFGGVIFGSTGQTPMLALTKAGAAGTYGTVAEPANDPGKFPTPQVYFYQFRGFSLAEAYYQSVGSPYLGLIVGEPLSAPFQKPPTVRWTGTNLNAVFTGVVPLSVQATAADAHQPVQRIDLFIDGKFDRTLTNLAPRPGNVLSVSLNGYPVACTVSSNADLGSIANSLSAQFNSLSSPAVAAVTAVAHGDRVELRSLSTNGLGYAFKLADPGEEGSVSHSYRVNYLPELSSPRILSATRDNAGLFRVELGLPAAMPYVLEASTNLRDWVPVATNTAPGLAEVVDRDSAVYAARFYRVNGLLSAVRPTLRVLPGTDGSPSTVQVRAAIGRPYVLQASADLVEWTSLATNAAGDDLSFVDPGSVGQARGFYRTWVPPTNPPPAVLSITTNPAGGFLLQVQGAFLPYTVEVSTNLTTWSALATNFAAGEIEVLTESSIGTADALSTYLTASRSTFLDSAAYGVRDYTVQGVGGSNAWLALQVWKPNGAAVFIGATNGSGSATAAALSAVIVDAVNSRPDLAGPDGIVAEDLTTDTLNNTHFNLRARSPGLQALGFRFQLSASAPMTTWPSGQAAVANGVDLQPANHLYVTAGAAGLPVSFSLDTTVLADGYHDLTAVAYEGSHVRAQGRANKEVVVGNSTFGASLTLADLGDTNQVSGTYHIRVTANTNAVSRIALYTTGGLWAAVTNQSTATFSIDGSQLGPGLHSFFAIAESNYGQQYRTQPRSVRFTQ